MAPEISHAYEIEFDEKTKCSTLKEGYFWNQHQQADTKETV